MQTLKLLNLFFIIPYGTCGILYPQDSVSREVKSLDGIWTFRLDGTKVSDFEKGFREQWYKGYLDHWGSEELELMPVPSSYNDITQKTEIRDHIGWVWYQRSFWIPKRWFHEEKAVFLRFGSVTHFATVWLNGEHIMNHTGGYLPFQADVTNLIIYGKQNILTLAVNNTLDQTTIPQGTLHQPTDHSRYPHGFVYQEYNFDYFNFAGIHRPVFLYTTPKLYIDDITVTTLVADYANKIGKVEYSVEFREANHFPGNSILEEPMKDATCVVAIIGMDGHKVARHDGCNGQVDIQNVKLWWPHLSGPKDEVSGYLYTLQVSLISESGELDVYNLKFGVRSISTSNTSILVNGRPFYFRGFGRHEDYSIRGRGVDFAHIIKDHNLIKWTGANSYRTSHYPYAEEILDLTDRFGIVIIDESPAIGLSGFGNELLSNHLEVMKEFIQRDKNRASVLVWSIGNEPKSMENGSLQYFETVIKETRNLDPQKRPITIVLSQGFANDKGPQMDIISINRYFGWYGDTGRTEVIPYQIPTEIHSWYAKYKKPVLITEYGAGTVAGMHMNPSFVWTEDYQVDYHIAHFKSFDLLRNSTPYFIGEMIWNFADFATPPETFRPWLCMKGIFTRERQPKRVARFIKQRYLKLMNEVRS